MKKMLERENLSWVALASLNKAIELIEHREAGKQMSDVEAASLAWAREMYVESYKHHGKRSPLWDQHVIEGLEWWAIYVANIPTRHEGLPIQIYHLMLKAKNAGCEDGLVQHCMMNLFPLMGALPPGLHRRVPGEQAWRRVLRRVLRWGLPWVSLIPEAWFLQHHIRWTPSWRAAAGGSFASASSPVGETLARLFNRINKSRLIS